MEKAPERKLVIIPGGTGGLGAGIARRLAQWGDIDILIPSRGTKTRYRRNQSFTEKNITVVSCDYYKEKNVRKLAEEISKKYQIAALIYCAGSFHGHKEINSYTDDDVVEKFQTNIRSFMHFLRYLIPEMKRNKEGKVIAFGSLAASQHKPFLGLSIWAKNGLWSIIKTLSNEVSKDGINANMISPSIVDTPKERIIFPEDTGEYWLNTDDVAALVEFLCFDPAAKNIHGQNLEIYNPDPSVVKSREDNLRSRGVEVNKDLSLQLDSD